MCCLIDWLHVHWSMVRNIPRMVSLLLMKRRISKRRPSMGFDVLFSLHKVELKLGCSWILIQSDAFQWDLCNKNRVILFLQAVNLIFCFNFCIWLRSENGKSEYFFYSIQPSYIFLQESQSKYFWGKIYSPLSLKVK